MTGLPSLPLPRHAASTAAIVPVPIPRFVPHSAAPSPPHPSRVRCVVELNGSTVKDNRSHRRDPRDCLGQPQGYPREPTAWHAERYHLPPTPSTLSEGVSAWRHTVLGNEGSCVLAKNQPPPIGNWTPSQPTGHQTPVDSFFSPAQSKKGIILKPKKKKGDPKPAGWSGVVGLQ